MFETLADTCEKSGYIPNPRKHYSGRDVWFRLGDHVHGDEQDFLGQSPAGKYVVHHSGPHDPCIEPDHAFSEIGFGVDFDELAMVGRIAEPGLELGLVVFGDEIFTEEKKVGLALGDVGVKIGPLTPEKKAGLALGVVVTKISGELIAKKIGLALGDVGRGPVTPTIAAGLELGSMVTIVAGETPTKPAGLELAAAIVVTSLLAPELETGLSLGVVGHPPTTPEFRAGLLLGTHELRSIEGSASGSGSDGSGGWTAASGSGFPCEDAIYLEIGPTYTFAEDAGSDEVWYAFSGWGGHTYTVAYKTVSGSDRSMTYFVGPCDSGNPGFHAHFAALHSFDYTADEEPTIILAVSNRGFTGPGTFMIRITPA